MRHLTWIAALLIVSTAACKKDDKSSKSEPATPKAGDGVAEAPAGGGGGGAAKADQNGAQVKLVSNGAEPRIALRYAPAQGDKDRLDMVMKMGMEMKMGGAGGMPRMDVPPMTMVFDTEVTSSTADAFELAAAVTDVKVDAPAGSQVAQAMQPELAKIIGMKATSRMTRRGILEKADVKMPANVTPQMMQMMESMKQSLSQATAPFPEEPVGVGASWQVISNVETNGMKITQTATFELVSLDGTKGTAKIKLDQTAPPQEIHPPGTPASIKTRLSHFASSGSGEVSFDLSRVVPVKSTLTMKSDFAISAEGQGDFSMKVDLGMDLTATKVK